MKGIIKKSKFKKILAVFCIIVFGILGICNISQAQLESDFTGKVDIYIKDTLNCFKLNSVFDIEIDYFEYNTGNNLYPVYLLEDLENYGLFETNRNVEIKNVMQDSNIWRIITNGYPYKTASQLGCNSNLEAYGATQIAILDELYDTDVYEWIVENEQGYRVLDAFEKVKTNANSSNEYKQSGEISLVPIDNGWYFDTYDGKSISKRYTVETNIDVEDIYVYYSKFNVSNIKVVNEINELQSNFIPGEILKINIALSGVDSYKVFENFCDLNINASFTTNPVLYAKESNNYKYAFIAEPAEEVTKSIEIPYSVNSTKIIITKQDEVLKNKLSGAVYNLLDENKKYIGSTYTTSEDGKVVIDGMIPGTYYVEESIAPNGYIKYEELIQIHLEYNQEVSLTVNSYSKPIIEDKDTSFSTNHNVIGNEEEVLPNTGY